MKYFGGTVEADDVKSAEAVLRMRIGENLTALREMTEKNREEVARDIDGLTADTLRNYELGNSSIPYCNAWKLADYYNVTIGSLGRRIAYEPAGAVR